MKSKTIRTIMLIILGTALVPIGGLVINYGWRLADIETRKMKGELLPFNIDSNKPIEIQVGGVHANITLSELNEGFDMGRYVYIEGFHYPFQIRFEDERFLVSVNITDANGETVAKITRNQWSVNNNPTIAYDRNYNAYAFEVIDSNLVPVIQVIFFPQNKMYLGGLFYFSNNRKMLLTDDMMIIDPSSDDLDFARNHKIFKYPSEEYLGEMVVENSYLVSRTYTWWIASGLILFVSGILINSYVAYLKFKKK